MVCPWTTLCAQSLVPACWVGSFGHQRGSVELGTTPFHGPAPGDVASSHPRVSEASPPPTTVLASGNEVARNRHLMHNNPGIVALRYKVATRVAGRFWAGWTAASAFLGRHSSLLEPITATCRPAALPPSVIDPRVSSTLLGVATPSRLRSCLPTDCNQIRTEPT